MKSFHRNNKQLNGFILLESLISIVVVSLGILGIAKFNALVAQSTTDSRERTAAIHRAQAAMDDLRLVGAGQDNCNALLTQNSPPRITVTGNNNDTVVTVRICESWGDGSCTAAQGTPESQRRVIINTAASCIAANTAQLDEDNPGGGNGATGFLRTPTGRGQVGRGEVRTNPVGAVNNPDGTRTWVSPTGVRELLDADGRVLLSIQPRSCEFDPVAGQLVAPEFSTISGKVFVEAQRSGQNSGQPLTSIENLTVISSDASVCLIEPYNTTNVVRGGTGNSIQYWFTNYICYVGPEWWGNIGVVRLDNPNENQRVCVGNPVDTVSTSLFSKHARLSRNRNYRGLLETSPNVFKTVGIGFFDEPDLRCENEKRYIPTHYRNHNFLHAVISGNPGAGASQCQNLMLPFNNFTPSSILTTGNSSPVITLDPASTTTPIQITAATKSITSTSSSNPGRFFCLNAFDGVTCNATETPPPGATTRLFGTVTAMDGAVLPVNTLQASIQNTDIDGSFCTINNTTSTSPAVYSYECNFDWEGFAGNAWNGIVKFAPGVGDSNAPTTNPPTLCRDNEFFSITPSTVATGAQYLITDRFQDDLSTANINESNSLVFSSIPVAASEIQLDFSLRIGSCTTVGAPVVRWATTGSQPRDLLWPRIVQSGSTIEGYQVFRCTSANASACTVSIGTVPFAFVAQPTAANANTVSFDVADFSIGQTVCFQVRTQVAPSGGALGSSFSLPSQRACVTRTGNNSYTYDPNP